MLNRLVCEKTVDNGDNVVVQYIYTLGAAGERKSVTELDRTVEYSYDSLYRLTSETITEGEKVTAYTYAYDNVSNRILKTENGAETEYIYNALNQLVSDSETSYEYDLNGNLVRVIGSAQSALYEYNAENKLIKATVQNGSLVIEESYTYDYQGNRTSKTTHKSNGEFEYTKYLNDNSSLTNVLAEIDENGTAKCVYTIGVDLVLQERDGRTSFYLYDGHGAVTALANESGVVTDTYSYDAFGNLLKSTGSTKNCYRYCGEQFDETTGLYYLRARYMDTTTGRFISQDTYQGDINDPVSLHKYLYCASNPISYIDSNGNCFGLAMGMGFGMGVDLQLAVSVIKTGLAIIAALTVAVVAIAERDSITSFFQDCTVAISSGVMSSSDSKEVVYEKAKVKTKRRRKGYIAYNPLDHMGRATKAFGLITIDMLSNNPLDGATMGTEASVDPVDIHKYPNLQRGHLIARQLGGRGDTLRNITPIYAKVNKGVMKLDETAIAGYVLAAGFAFDIGVYMSVETLYIGNDGVPEYIFMSAISENGGFFLHSTFENKQ